MTSPSVAPTEALDHALESLSTGDADGALRWSIPALGDEGSGAAALDVVGRALDATGQAPLALKAFALAVPWLVHHGIASHAVAAALAHGRLAGDRSALQSVAKALGTGGPPTPMPPPALSHATVVPLGDGLSREALIEKARDALATLAPPTTSRARSKVALWSVLGPKAFERFALTLSTQLTRAHEVVMREGDVGHEAYLVARGELRIFRRDATGKETQLAVLGPGAIAGEMALVTDAPRAANVTSTRAALLLVAPRAAIDAASAEVPALAEQIVAFCRRRLLDNVLRTSPLLREVPVDEREGLSGLFATKTYEPGETLIHQGSQGDGLHLIATGTAEVTRSEGDGSVLQLTVLGPGACVGEISLVLRRAATASVVARTPCVSMVLPAERFLEIVRTRPTLFARIYELAVQREDETLTVVGQQAEDADDAVIV